LTQTFLHSKLFPCIDTADHTFGKFKVRRPARTGEVAETPYLGNYGFIVGQTAI
jgi:inorganic pyrophosphatase